MALGTGKCCGHEAAEDHLGLERAALEFRVELDAYEEGMVWDFDDLHQVPFGVGTREAHPGRLELLTVGVVEFVPVPMPFVDCIRGVQLVSQGAGFQCAVIGSKAHGAAFLYAILIIHQADDRMGRVGRVFEGVRPFKVENVARVLDHCALHAQADAKEGHAIFSGPSNCFDFPLKAPLAKATGDQHASYAF